MFWLCISWKYDPFHILIWNRLYFDLDALRSIYRFAEEMGQFSKSLPFSYDVGLAITKWFICLSCFVSNSLPLIKFFSISKDLYLTYEQESKELHGIAFVNGVCSQDRRYTIVKESGGTVTPLVWEFYHFKDKRRSSSFKSFCDLRWSPMKLATSELFLLSLLDCFEKI